MSNASDHRLANISRRMFLGGAAATIAVPAIASELRTSLWWQYPGVSVTKDHVYIHVQKYKAHLLLSKGIKEPFAVAQEMHKLLWKLIKEFPNHTITTYVIASNFGNNFVWPGPSAVQYMSHEIIALRADGTQKMIKNRIGPPDTEWKIGPIYA